MDTQLPSPEEKNSTGNGWSSGQNMPAPVPHPRPIKLIVSLILLLLIAAVVFFGFVYWSKRHSGNSPVANQSVNPPAGSVSKVETIEYQTGALLANAQLVFPKVTQRTVITKTELPKSLDLLTLEGSSAQSFKSIEYEANHVGFEILYTMSSSTVQQVSDFAQRQVQSSVAVPQWELKGGSRSSLVGYVEYTNSQNTNQARFMFFQKDKDVKVVVQIMGNYQSK